MWYILGTNPKKNTETSRDLTKKRSGILLHITSLPSKYGIGDLGPEAYRFVDFLFFSKQKYWQILPLNFPIASNGYSPYFSNSAFAGNQLLISPDILIEEGLLMPEEVNPIPEFEEGTIDYPGVIEYKNLILDKAYNRFKASSENDEFEIFCRRESEWLEDFTLFMAIKEDEFGKVWHEWPNPLRDRIPDALEEAKERLADKINKEEFLQYIFFKQWDSLKSYCSSKGIKIIGDIPIYVSYDSADVWVDPHIFKLDEDKKPLAISGVPPDYFSETGQLWNNPVYRWSVLKKTGYNWWIKRLEHTLNTVDVLRIDHFRGLVQYWEIPAGEKTAINGKWENVPTYDFFDTILEYFKSLPVIVEDLGLITPDVKDAMKHYAFPGMRVLQFAFGEDKPDHPYLPQNYIENCVAYIGTHDNNTLVGWLADDASFLELERLLKFLGEKQITSKVNWKIIKKIMESEARTVIITVQDIIGLGSNARMNDPRNIFGNWKWRLLTGELTQARAKMLLDVTQSTHRAN